MTGEDVTLLLLLEARDLATAVVSKLRSEIGKLSGSQKIAAAAFAGIGLASAETAKKVFDFTKSGVQQAQQYQAAMTQLHTQAQASWGEVKTMYDYLLTQGPKLGVAPMDLVRGLYNIESIGARAKKSLAGLHVTSIDLVNAMAKLQEVATAGNPGSMDSKLTAQALLAPLVTNIVTQHIKGRRDQHFTSAAQVAGAFNKVVGIGDMRMPDLLSALGNGILQTASSQGVDFRSLMASMDVLTDSTLAPQKASIYLRQVMSMVSGAQTKPKTEGLLESIGLTGTKLQDDMRGPGGMITLFDDLRKHLAAAGELGVQTGKSIATAFDVPGGTNNQLVKSLTFIESKLSVMTAEGKKKLADMLGVGDRSTSIATGLTRLIDQIKGGKNNPDFARQIFNVLFGGARTGSGAATLLTEPTRLHERYRELGDPKKQSIDPAWAATMKTAVAQENQFHASVQATKIALGTDFLPVLTKVLTAINKILVPLAEWTTHHKKLAAIIAVSLVAFFSLVAVLALTSAAYIVLAGAAATADIAIGATLGMFALWIVVIAAVIAAIVIAAYEIYKHWGAISKFFEKLWGGVLAGVKLYWNDIGGWLQTQHERIIALGEAAWTRFKGWMSTLWSAVRNGVVTAWNDITSFLSGVWQGITSGLLSAWNGVIAWFAGLPQRILDALGSAANWLLGVGEDAITGLWHGMQTAWTAVVGWLETFAKLVATGVGDAAHWLYSIGSDAVTGLWNGMKFIFDGGLMGWFNRFGSMILGFVGSAARWLYNTGDDAINGLWDGAKAVWLTVTGWLGSLASKVLAAVGSAAKWLYSHGVDAINGIWDGMKFIWSSVSAWLGSVGAKTTSAVGSAAKWLYATGQDAISGIWDGMKAVWNGVKGASGGVLGWLRQFPSMIEGGVGDLSHVLWNAGVSVMQGLWDGLKSKWNEVKSWLSGVGAAITNVKGPPSKDAVLLVDNGRLIMQSLQKGLQSAWPGVAAYLGGVTNQIGSSVATPNFRFAGASAGGGSVNVTFDLRESTFADQQSQQRMLDRAGQAFVQRVLPGAGMHVRRG